ncbi:hypothetical protein OJAV_G00071920 [Oryzias javanicus]|uniref:Ionotropic glutamate receptor L-glutamate and glycine-binding domain-containing protein n=1 Tax=Oryzias javanicus TaxID=123683 RepID=A0A437D997_ORYJA|nr:hypothetical protein OJAV_G00071920 [Oryzias javanicus]
MMKAEIVSLLNGIRTTVWGLISSPSHPVLPIKTPQGNAGWGSMKTSVALVFWTASVTAWVSTADAKDLSITTIKEEPYTMSKGSGLEGFCIDLIAELSKKLGFTYKGTYTP